MEGFVKALVPDMGLGLTPYRRCAVRVSHICLGGTKTNGSDVQMFRGVLAPTMQVDAAAKPASKRI